LYCEWSGDNVLSNKLLKYEYEVLISKLEDFNLIIWSITLGVGCYEKIVHVLNYIINSKAFSNVLTVIIILNCFQMSLEGNYFSQSTWETIDKTNAFFNAVYIFEFIIKIIGVGVKKYFKDINNYIDFIVVGLSVMDFALMAIPHIGI